MRPPARNGRRDAAAELPTLFDAVGGDLARSRARVHARDLTRELIFDWLDDACVDVAIDPADERDILVVVDDTKLNVRVDAHRACIYLACPIACRAELDDRSLLFEALNHVHQRAMFVRGVVGGSEYGDTWVRWEHELHAVDGIVTRRQLVKLVRRIKQESRDAHRALHDFYGDLADD